jgi:putative colanic acid biosynthesis glycosyltransferase
MNIIGGMREKGHIKRSKPGLPLVSIITTVRNAKNGIERVIEEVQRQTYTNKEHIIIDGGSNDGTLEVIRRRDRDVDYWASEADAGIYDAMNRGIDAAVGEWLYFFGADDSFYRRDTLEVMIQKREISDDIGLVLGNVIYPDGRLFRSRFDKKLYFKNCIHHQSAFYRRCVFDNFRYGHDASSGFKRHFGISGDYQLNLMLFTRGVRHLYRDEIVARCGRGVSMEGRFAGYREEIIARHQYMNFYKAVFFDITTLLRYGWKQISGKKGEALEKRKI